MKGTYRDRKNQKLIEISFNKGNRVIDEKMVLYRIGMIIDK